MNKIYYALLVCLLCVVAGCSGDHGALSGPITTEVPPRPAGQEDMVAYAAEPLDTVRVGFIGLGMRGPGAVNRFAHIPGTKIVALCDIDTAVMARLQADLEAAGRPRADVYAGNDSVWKQLVERDDIDLVYIATDWKSHVPMSLYAMEHGKHVAVEVPAAMELDEIWDIINTSERTRRHCMMLENCVYDFFELTTLNMAQKGLFGDILHVEGSYIHNLDQFWNEYEGNWRLDFNAANRGDVYATHGMGPAAQLVDLHRGNKMNTLVSMDTRAVTGPELLRRNGASEAEAASFANGDHTMTMISTERGQTIHIQHDVMNPRPYSRMYQLTGTKGFANKYPVEGYAFADAATLEGVPDHEDLSGHDFVPDSLRIALMRAYRHPIQVELEEIAREVGGHGGMDFIMDYRLIYCLLNGLPLDQDVYDAAEWSAIGELSRISIENGSAPVEVPDFTRGAWKKLNGYHHYMAGE